MSDILFKSYIFIFVLGLISINACSEDDPVAPQEEHFEAIGMIIETSGIRVASILRGETDDTLHAFVNIDSDHYEVKFYDEDENIVDPPDDEDQTFDWQIDNPEILEVSQHEAHQGEFEFHLRGKAEGTTFIEFFIMHLGHPDFRSGKFPVKVSAQ
ncbi:MAG: hypothetical protein PHW27_06060 [Melioribacteraceae bacterium]|nr:hypothetical protein [Melioribacteraceae bacterium]MDD3558122.1 hypothetical protein [Melioribacteraceae bacterium]